MPIRNYESIMSAARVSQRDRAIDSFKRLAEKKLIFAHNLCVMILCTQVLYIINSRIRIVQNFVDRPSASTSSASSRRVFVLLYKAFIRAKIYDKQGNPAIRFYKQRYAERYVIKHLLRKIGPLQVPFPKLSC
jgi:hypothetical protein